MSGSKDPDIFKNYITLFQWCTGNQSAKHKLCQWSLKNFGIDLVRDSMHPISDGLLVPETHRGHALTV